MTYRQDHRLLKEYALTLPESFIPFLPLLSERPLDKRVELFIGEAGVIGAIFSLIYILFLRKVKSMEGIMLLC